MRVLRWVMVFTTNNGAVVMPDEGMTFTYDAIDRLQSANQTTAAGYTQSFGYNAIGNIITSVFAAIFVGIAHATLGKKFGGKGGDLVTIGVGAMLALGAGGWSGLGLGNEGRVQVLQGVCGDLGRVPQCVGILPREDHIRIDPISIFPDFTDNRHGYSPGVRAPWGP